MAQYQAVKALRRPKTPPAFWRPVIARYSPSASIKKVTSRVKNKKIKAIESFHGNQHQYRENEPLCARLLERDSTTSADKRAYPEEIEGNRFVKFILIVKRGDIEPWDKDASI